VADKAVVVQALVKPGKGNAPNVTSLVVRVAGVDKPALTIEGAIYSPTQGDTVTTIPLSDGSVLLLGMWSQ
jgi:hypothetical protein